MKFHAANDCVYVYPSYLLTYEKVAKWYDMTVVYETFDHHQYCILGF